MKRLSALPLIAVAVCALIALATPELLGGRGTPARTLAATLPATEPASELPADTKPLTFDAPLLENLDLSTPIKFYTFTAKANQIVQLAVEPKSGKFYNIVTITTLDLQTVIGGTTGDNVIGAMLAVQIPTDGQYAVSVQYNSTSTAPLAPGSYQLILSNYPSK
jgi:hypothetical protein